ncbi:ATP-binding protein [Roseovarius pelagicus]|uniref:ATP-binding protein n=1 Tax=Roseovarius pelagicus TaxID=2980108 RepID=UPI003570C358
MPLGLIANEFATNSLKHAFGEKSGTITLNLEVEASTLSLTLGDDGRGLPNDGEQDGTRHGGTGLRLMEGMAQQIGARLHRSEVKRGRMLVVELVQ